MIEDNIYEELKKISVGLKALQETFDKMLTFFDYYPKLQLFKDVNNIE